jgi:putative NADH-flavin reductase
MGDPRVFGPPARHAMRGCRVMSRVCVMGGSRGIGLATVKALLERGHEVTAFSRSAERLDLHHDRLTCVSGDAHNRGDVERAVSGQDAVVQALGVALNLKLLTGPITLFSQATQVLVPVLEDAGVKRLVAVTGFGAGDSARAISSLQRVPFRIVFGHAYADKSRQEAIIKASSLDWTIVRPGVLTNQPLRKPYRIRMVPSDWRNGIISRAAVADYIANVLFDPAARHSEPVLAN